MSDLSNLLCCTLRVVLRGRKQSAASHLLHDLFLLKGVRRLLLLPDQTGAGSAAHLQLGSAGTGSNVSQGDEVDGGQAPGPAGQGQGDKPTRVQGAQQAPLVALQATSFLDMGAPSEAVQPAAAPSHGRALPSHSSACSDLTPSRIQWHSAARAPGLQQIPPAGLDAASLLGGRALQQRLCSLLLLLAHMGSRAVCK